MARAAWWPQSLGHKEPVVTPHKGEPGGRGAKRESPDRKAIPVWSQGDTDSRITKLTAAGSGDGRAGDSGWGRADGEMLVGRSRPPLHAEGVLGSKAWLGTAADGTGSPLAVQRSGLGISQPRPRFNLWSGDEDPRSRWPKKNPNKPTQKTALHRVPEICQGRSAHRGATWGRACGERHCAGHSTARVQLSRRLSDA